MEMRLERLIKDAHDYSNRGDAAMMRKDQTLAMVNYRQAVLHFKAAEEERSKVPNDPMFWRNSDLPIREVE